MGAEVVVVQVVKRVAPLGVVVIFFEGLVVLGGRGFWRETGGGGAADRALRLLLILRLLLWARRRRGWLATGAHLRQELALADAPRLKLCHQAVDIASAHHTRRGHAHRARE
jgi:hypothetical protein